MHECMKCGILHIVKFWRLILSRDTFIFAWSKFMLCCGVLNVHRPPHPIKERKFIPKAERKFNKAGKKKFHGRLEWTGYIWPVALNLSPFRAIDEQFCLCRGKIAYVLNTSPSLCQGVLFPIQTIHEMLFLESTSPHRLQQSLKFAIILHMHDLFVRSLFSIRRDLNFPIY